MRSTSDDLDQTTVPQRMAAAGRLYLRCSGGAAAAKVARWMRTWCRHAEHLADAIAIDVPRGGLMDVLTPLAKALSPAEQAAVRVVFQPSGQPPHLLDYFETGSLARFLARRQSGWLLDMMREERLTSVFQPIVHAGDGRVFGYECLLRGLDGGRLIESAPIFQIAGGAGLLFHLDQTARWLAIREAARHDIRSKIFINFTPTAVENPMDCLERTAALVDDLGIDRRQIVFEVIENEHVLDLDRLEALLQHYRDLDFGVALDDVGAGYASLNALEGIRPDYSKLDIQLIRNVDRDPYKAILTGKLLEAGQELGVKTIAEGVESAGEYAWLRDHGADFVQGFYVARPGSPPPLQ
jgi:EAL domain-containing protein (putative c-di-GMP-specific phosphodiesterase class I)